ncbi:hypothetical protein BCIN_01g09180 [Botrytis cinerea B05.10]|uniref:SCP domain-containing protein n=2 Tax=Botryotinia fuckeliana TaxID=40559 RepID=A0A384J7I8_BOTFB|nr:hypothetical protein BCIN_01g09180 [Botrytis cinerea B05.10]ATZ46294.1 hypothetical protein BCIN_01g09180 [Botrytis cinerea B05.10]EMR87466.1 putative extracellular scp domain protein [Botrytis cinerea BcDW1]
MLIRMPINLLLLIPLATAKTITVTTVTESAISQPTSTSYTSDSQFQSDMVAAHNFYRGEQNVSNLEWNDTSAKIARDWSKRCVFEHSGGPTGENLAAGYPNATSSVDAWGLERLKYSYSSPGFSEDTGHFTQLVWSNTTSVGCARTNCAGENDTPGWYVVCEYWPAGNVVNGGGGDKEEFFRDNVKEQVKGEASDTVESGVTSAGSSIAGGSVVGWKGREGELRWGVLMGVMAVGAAGLMF